MASKIICILLACFFANFFAIGGAKYCYSSSYCGYYQSCCSDRVCRRTCHYCSYDHQCGTGEECCDGGKCLSACPTAYSPGYTVGNGGVIAGAVISTIVFFAIVIFVVAYCCCASCPFYRYRSHGTVMTVQPANQTQVTTTQTLPMQQMQQNPPPGNYNQPPPGCAQPPPLYSSYPQKPAQYPPPPTKGQPAVPPPVSDGEPVKY